MNTKALRQKILDLAIHGKLVPQDLNDEPASVLLERIKAKKERLIKEGKIKRSKQSKTACDKLHYPFELPEGWCWTNVSDIAYSILYGVSESAKSEGEYRLLRITDIQDNTVNWSTVPYTNYDESKVSDYLLKDGDILFARTGATVGKSYLVKGINIKAIYASYLIRVQTFKDVMPEYVKYFFESGFYWEQIQSSSVGIGQPNVNGTILSQLMMPIPPREEQRRIVDNLRGWLNIIDIIENCKDNLQISINQAKSKILDLAIHGKLVPQDPTDEPASELLKRINPKAEITCDNPQYGKLPKGWCYGFVGDYVKTVTDFVASGSFSSLRENVKYYNSINYAILVRIKDFQCEFKKDLVYTDKHGYEFLSKSNLFGGELIFSNVGSIGKVFVVPKLDKKMTLAPNSIMVRFKNEEHQKWFYYLFLSNAGLDLLKSITSATAVGKFNKTDFKKLMIPLPPLNEQHRIVAKIEELFAQLDNIASSL